MRFAFRRSALFAAASLIALGLAAPSLAQDAPQTPPVQDAPKPAAEASPVFSETMRVAEQASQKPKPAG